MNNAIWIRGATTRELAYNEEFAGGHREKIEHLVLLDVISTGLRRPWRCAVMTRAYNLLRHYI